MLVKLCKLHVTVCLHSQYIYSDNKLLEPVFMLCCTMSTGLWVVWAKQHAPNTWCLSRPTRRESNLPKLKISQGLTVLILQQDMTRKKPDSFWHNDYLLLYIPPNHPIFTLLDEISDYNTNIAQGNFWAFVFELYHFCHFIFQDTIWFRDNLKNSAALKGWCFVLVLILFPP